MPLELCLGEHVHPGIQDVIADRQRLLGGHVQVVGREHDREVVREVSRLAVQLIHRPHRVLADTALHRGISVGNVVIDGPENHDETDREELQDGGCLACLADDRVGGPAGIVRHRTSISLICQTEREKYFSL
jgi:hypothetical protein